jgi:hypothetical protein
MRAFVCAVVVVALIAFTAMVQGKSMPAMDILSQMPSYGSGGGIKCAGCTVVVGLLSNLADYRQQPIERVLDEFCNILPSELQSSCEELVAKVWR